MLDQADLTLLTIILLILTASRLYAGIILRRDAKKLQKYKLYKVRDDLIYLIATGKLKKDDFVFKCFYGASNQLVKTVEDINLASLVRAIGEARRQGLDPAAENKVKQIHDALKSKDQEVISAVNGFYRAVSDILVENSLTLQILVKCKPVAQALQIRVAPDLKQLFEKAASASGLGLSAWARERLLQAARRDLKHAEEA